MSKRAFDIVSSIGVLIVVAPVLAFISYKIWRAKDGPIFYLSERMKTPTRGFQLIKFRTMTHNPTEKPSASGGHIERKVTRLGAKLRRSRLDELPQLINILRGDMSFVGPRPPLRRYVEICPEIYQDVLRNKPGVTGLASLIFHQHEERILAGCETPEATEEVYVRRCVPRKGNLDLIYQDRQNFCLDAWIIFRTLEQAFTRPKV